MSKASLAWFWLHSDHGCDNDSPITMLFHGGVQTPPNILNAAQLQPDTDSERGFRDTL
jgi:hypothetical protein